MSGDGEGDRPARADAGGPVPPRWAEWLLRRAVPWRYRDEHLGDLHEGFRRRSARVGAASARRWYVRQALRSLPGALRLRYQTRNDEGRGTGMESIAQDLRYGLRALWKSPGFTIVSTLTLALAIGVNTSVFSLVSVIVFADLPMQESASVSLIRSVNAELDIDQGSVSEGDFLELVERARSFESLVALTERSWVLTGADQPMRITGFAVSPGTTESWRLPPILGRGFLEEEGVPGAPLVAMLGHGFWRDHFAGRPDIVGGTIRLDGSEYTIVGVMDPRFEFASFATGQVLVPLRLDRASPDRASRSLFVSGRLAPGTTQDVATEEIRVIGEQLADAYPVQNRGWGIWSAPVLESLVDDDANTILLLLQLAVGGVILIACANIANMLLARGTARAREIAVRSALGAGRERLVRQLLTESLVVSLLAGGLGLAFAWGLNRALVWISAGTEVVFQMADLDARVLGFTLLVSLVAPMVFGLFPAVRVARSGPAATLRDGRSSDGGRSGKRSRGVLVTAQVALALTLMIGAGLVTRTVVNLQLRPLGFDPSELVTVTVVLPSDMDGDARVRFFDEASEAFLGIPGVEGVERTNALPAVDFGALRPLQVEGRVLPEGRAAPSALMVTVSPGYFDLIGLPLVGGRPFSEADGPEAPSVAIVSRAAADELWPGEDPVGRRFAVADSDEWVEVVGIAADVRATTDLDQGSSNIYLPHAQDPRGRMYLVARSARDGAELAGPMRSAIRSVDGDQPVDAIRTLERAQYESTATNYALLTLFITFAVFALVMSAIGIYGVMAYSVSQRRGEIGLRMALGAEAGRVRRMVVWQGARLVGAGIGVGMILAYLESRLLANVVFGISPTDAVTFTAVPAVIIVVATLATLVPALRATRMNPAATLRAE